MVVVCGGGRFSRLLWWEDTMPPNVFDLLRAGSAFVLIGGSWRAASAQHRISIAVPVHEQEWHMNKHLAAQRWGIWIKPSDGIACEQAWTGLSFCRWHALACTLQTFFSDMELSMRSGVSSVPVASCTLGLRVTASGDQWVQMPRGSVPVLNLLRALLREAGLEEEVRFTSVHVTNNLETRMHIDGVNAGTAWLTAVGQFSGGMVWQWDPSGTHFLDVPADAGAGLQLFRGARVRGSACEVRHRFLPVQQNKPHATLPWQGDRWSLVLFCRAESLLSSVEQELRGAGFLVSMPLRLEPQPATVSMGPVAAATASALQPGQPPSPRPAPGEETCADTVCEESLEPAAGADSVPTTQLLLSPPLPPVPPPVSPLALPDVSTTEPFMPALPPPETPLAALGTAGGATSACRPVQPPTAPLDAGRPSSTWFQWLQHETAGVDVFYMRLTPHGCAMLLQSSGCAGYLVRAPMLRRRPLLVGIRAQSPLDYRWTCHALARHHLFVRTVRQHH